MVGNVLCMLIKPKKLMMSVYVWANDGHCVRLCPKWRSHHEQTLWPLQSKPLIRHKAEMCFGHKKGTLNNNSIYFSSKNRNSPSINWLPVTHWRTVRVRKSSRNLDEVEMTKINEPWQRAWCCRGGENAAYQQQRPLHNWRWKLINKTLSFERIDNCITPIINFLSLSRCRVMKSSWIEKCCYLIW